MEMLELLFTTYGGGSAIAIFLAIKGAAAYLSNNANTQSWGKAGAVIDWLASANKKSKFTGNMEVDLVINEVIKRKKPKGKLGKLLNFLS